MARAWALPACVTGDILEFLPDADVALAATVGPAWAEARRTRCPARVRVTDLSRPAVVRLCNTLRWLWTRGYRRLWVELPHIVQPGAFYTWGQLQQCRNVYADMMGALARARTAPVEALLHWEPGTSKDTDPPPARMLHCVGPCPEMSGPVQVLIAPHGLPGTIPARVIEARGLWPHALPTHWPTGLQHLTLAVTAYVGAGPDYQAALRSLSWPPQLQSLSWTRPANWPADDAPVALSLGPGTPMLKKVTLDMYHTVQQWPAQLDSLTVTGVTSEWMAWALHHPDARLPATVRNLSLTVTTADPVHVTQFLASWVPATLHDLDLDVSNTLVIPMPLEDLLRPLHQLRRTRLVTPRADQWPTTWPHSVVTLDLQAVVATTTIDMDDPDPESPHDNTSPVTMVAVGVRSLYQASWEQVMAAWRPPKLPAVHTWVQRGGAPTPLVTGPWLPTVRHLDVSGDGFLSCVHLRWPPHLEALVLGPHQVAQLLSVAPGDAPPWPPTLRVVRVEGAPAAVEPWTTQGARQVLGRHGICPNVTVQVVHSPPREEVYTL